MPSVPARLLNPEEEQLARKQSRLADLEAELAEREFERATLQADLAALEKRYLEVVGRRYAELDQLEAQIAVRGSELFRLLAVPPGNESLPSVQFFL